MCCIKYTLPEGYTLKIEPACLDIPELMKDKLTLTYVNGFNVPYTVVRYGYRDINKYDLIVDDMVNAIDILIRNEKMFGKYFIELLPTMEIQQ